MRGSKGVTLVVRGPFQVFDADGTPITPKGRKECGLLALLAFAPNFCRPRSWLQNKLWSDRFPDQGKASLRRALSNIRKAFGPAAPSLLSDRNIVGLAADTHVDFRNDHAGTQGILEDLDLPDPEFENWLRDTRQHFAAAGQAAATSAAKSPQKPLIVIRNPNDAESPEQRFLTNYLCSTLADRLNILGDINVVVTNTDDPETRQAISFVDVSTLAGGHEWYIHLQLRGGLRKQVLWSGRLRLAMNVKDIWEGPELTAFLVKAIRAILDKNIHNTDKFSYFAIQNAALRLYSGNRADLELANATFDQVVGHDTSGLALAWQGFARLTEVLEFGDISDDLTDQAMGFVNEALTRTRSNPLVSALAAQVHLKFNQDPEYGAFLANAAYENCDQNPYALDALSQASFLHGDHAKGHELALWSRHAASELPNAFVWEMQCCLTALGLGKLEESRDHALNCHLRMPHYRPALRYLFALNLLLGNRDEAHRYLAKISMIEVGTNARSFLKPEYPIDTLRNLGLLGDLAQAIDA
ncbi:MAG TPA: hypothetical protein ENK28_15450 [Aliiroseovarius sp.]|nr:hypothetical protein [Aliiroseovarius sp.]